MDRVYGKINANVGQNKEPLIDFVKTENIIPDILHLFLRVSDKLINLLKSDLQQMDLTFSTLIEDNVNFKKYVDFLENIKIRKPYYLKDRNLVLRDLSGDEKKKLFNHIDLELFVGLPKNTVKKHIWDSFYDTVFKVKDDKITSEQLKHDTQNWLSKFISVVISPDDAVTPYIHIFVSHLHQQVEYLTKKGLSINSFSMQGLEKQNDFTTSYFQRCSNKKGDIMLQILEKRTRIELLTYVDDLVSFLNRRIQYLNVSSDDDNVDDETDI